MSEASRFARWLEWGARLGLLWLVVSFALQASGVLPAAIAPAQLVQWWGLPLDEYLRLSHAPTGWRALANLAQGEGAGLAGIALLAGCCIPALLALVPLYLRRGERVFAALCVAQVAVLALAASAWISTGY